MLKRLFTYSTYLAVFGIILASYLFYNYLAPQPLKFCTVNAAINCDAVTKGILAELFGVPVSLIGLIGYIIILYSSLNRFKKLHLFMTSFGMLFCLRLTYLEIFSQHVFCPICGLCQLTMLTLFILSLQLHSTKPA